MLTYRFRVAPRPYASNDFLAIQVLSTPLAFGFSASACTVSCQPALSSLEPYSTWDLLTNDARHSQAHYHRRSSPKSFSMARRLPPRPETAAHWAGARGQVTPKRAKDRKRTNIRLKSVAR